MVERQTASKFFRCFRIMFSESFRTGIKLRSNSCLLRGPYLWWHDFILTCAQALNWYWLQLSRPGLIPCLQPVCTGEIRWKLPFSTEVFTQCCNVFAACCWTFSSYTLTLSTIYFIAFAIQPHYSFVHCMFLHLWQANCTDEVYLTLIPGTPQPPEHVHNEKYSKQIYSVT